MRGFFCNQRGPSGCHTGEMGARRGAGRASCRTGCPGVCGVDSMRRLAPDPRLTYVTYPLRSCSWFAALLAFGGALRGQTVFHDWPVPLSPQTAAVVGDFTGDHRQSAYVLEGSTLQFVFEPRWYRAVSPVTAAGAVSGMVRLRPGSGSTRDRVLAANAAGGVVCQLNANGTFTTTTCLTSDWAGARGMVVRGQADDSGNAVVAINALGTSILTASGAVAGVPEHVASIAVGTQLDAVALVDWDQDGALEVVGITQGYVVPFELNGTPKALRYFGGTSAVVAVLANEPIGDRLAVVGRIGSTAYLWAIDRTVTNAGVAIPTGGLGVSGVLQATGLCAFDSDFDGDTDLLLGHAQAAHTLHIKNLRTSQNAVPFNGSSFAVLSSPVTGWPSGTISPCPPVWADVDLKPGPDLLQVLSAVNQYGVTSYAAPGAQLLAPIDWVMESTVDLDVDLVPAQASVTVKARAKEGIFTGYDQWRIVVWHQSDPNAGHLVDPVAIYSASGDTSTLDLSSVFVEEENQSYSTRDLPIPLSLTTYPLGGNHHFYVELRLLNEAAGGTWEDDAATHWAGLRLWAVPATTLQEGYAYMTYLDETPATDNDKKKVVATRSEHVAGIITRTLPPPFPPVTPPPQIPD
jgi:hypothetical protein